MKQKVFVAVLIIVALTALLVGCSSSTNYDGKTKIVYELEGGSYMNCELPIVQYYDFEEGSSNLIFSPQTLSRKDVERAGYSFTGWYRTRTQSGDDVTYSDKWDFDTDKVTTEGITLYAGWETVVKYTYRVCYVDADGNAVELGSYTVKAGDEFNDRKDFASKRKDGDYTAYVFKENGVQNVGYYLDKALTEPVAGYKHPGGEGDTAIDVYVKYLEGKWEIVRTASELTLAKSKNIYLDADIDMGGKTLTFGTYSKNFEGNNHTISNFTLPYNASKTDLKADIYGNGNTSVYISLFEKLDGATVKNVKFAGVKVAINGGMSTINNIYLAPFAVDVTRSTVENVIMAVEYTVVKFPTDTFDSADFTIFAESGYAKQDGSTITALTTTVVLADEKE